MRIAVLMPLLVLAACQQSNEAAMVQNNADLLADSMEAQADQLDAAADEQSEAADVWSLSDETDAITDARLLTGMQEAKGQSNDVQVSVTCTPNSANLIYKVAGFDKDADSSRLHTEFTPFGIVNSVIYRPDSRPAKQANTINPQYNNQTTITGDDAFQAASARTLTLRIQFDNSNETFSVDQDSDNFRRMIKPCFIARRAKLDEVQATQAKAAAPQAAPEVEATPSPDQPSQYRVAPVTDAPGDNQTTATQ